jgi:hypothetical protein
MIQINKIQSLPLLTALGLCLAGCTTPNASPPEARANTGYVDFHAESADDLCWEVYRYDERTQDFARLYSKLDPPPSQVLRLALAPGDYHLRVTFLNRVVLEPAIVQVEVKDGMITPVRIVSHAEGSALVQTSERQRGATAKGRFGRRTKFSSDETSMYRLSAETGASVPYQAREKMPYARASGAS